MKWPEIILSVKAGNFEKYEIATTDLHGFTRIYADLLVLTLACGCAGAHPGAGGNKEGSPLPAFAGTGRDMRGQDCGFGFSLLDFGGKIVKQEKEELWQGEKWLSMVFLSSKRGRIYIRRYDEMLRDLRKKRKKVLLKPDEVFYGGGIAMTRFGKTIVTKSNMTPKQHKAFKKKAAEQYPKMCEEINGRVNKIRKLVQGFNPLILLQCSYFHFACSTIGKTSEIEYGFEEMVTARMLDYIQSVIVSTPCSNVNITKFDETAWKELFNEVKSLYDTLIPWFQIYRSAFLEATQKDYDVNYDYFYVQAEMLWLSVRCDRYFVHDMPHLYDLLSPHDEIFNELFGISVNNFLKEIEKIQHSLSKGLGIVVNEMKEFQDKVMAEVEKKEDKVLESDLPNLAKETIKEKGWG